MKLDEAIKHAEEVAEKKERDLKVYESLEDRPLFTKEENECKECAKEHRQLAEWLKELKSYKEDKDIISRKAVLNLTKELRFNSVKGMEDYCYRCIDPYDVEDLPPVTPTSSKMEQVEWIPVSERLPKTYELVNCTCHSLIDDRDDWVVETVYIPQLPDSPYSDWGNIPMLNEGNCEVVAWIHRDIPKPYKAESEET